MSKQSVLRVRKQRVHKSIVKRTLVKGYRAQYPEYRISLPRDFVEQHGRNMYAIIGSIVIIVPEDDEKTLLMILERFPEIRRLVYRVRSNKHKKA